MVSHLEYRGNSTSVTVSADLAFNYGGPRLWRVFASASGRTLSLPDLDNLDVPTGKKLITFVNFGSNSFTVADSNGLGLARVVPSIEYLHCSSIIDTDNGSPVTGRSWIFRGGLSLTP